MSARTLPVVAITSLLIVLLLVGAGCTSIPGPDTRFTPSPTKTPVPEPTMRITTVKTTPLPTHTITATPAGAAITPAVTGQGTYETRTCIQMEGTIVRPGEMCPGSWLDAVDSFSCCSKTPVSAINRSASIIVEPLILEIDMADDPGSILP